MYVLEFNLSQLCALRDALDEAYERACEVGDDEFIEELDEVYNALKSAREKEVSE